MDDEKKDEEKDNYEYRLLRYEVYLKERHSLSDAARNSRQELDKSILTLSAGALAISLTFLHEIVPHPIKSTLPYLFISWTSFILSILFTLISFITSEKACIRQIVIAGKDYEEDNVTMGETEKNSWTLITKKINYFSMASFVAGLIILVVFSIINLNATTKEEPMAEQKPPIQAPKPLNPNTGVEPIKLPIKPPKK